MFTAAFAGPMFTAAFAAQGWAVAPGFLDDAEVTALRDVAAARFAAREFHPARVGRGDATRAAPALRGDCIRWLTVDDPDAAVRATLARLDALRIAINRTLFLGLERFETHFSSYAPGASYGIHVDRFRDDDSRVVSIVLYLNDDWGEADGGELRLYLPEPDPGSAPHCDIAPTGGTLVAFLSDRFTHEVLPARRDRWSLTGWYRRRNAALDIE